MSNIKVLNNKITINHPDERKSSDLCDILCQNLSTSKDFRVADQSADSIIFESIGQSSNLKFAPTPAEFTLNFDSNIKSIYWVTSSPWGGGGVRPTYAGTVNTSGETVTNASGEQLELYVTLKEGYVLDTVTPAAEDGETLSHTENTVYYYSSGINRSFTLTSKRSDILDLTNYTWTNNNFEYVQITPRGVIPNSEGTMQYRETYDILAKVNRSTSFYIINSLEFKLYDSEKIEIEGITSTGDSILLRTDGSWWTSTFEIISGKDCINPQLISWFQAYGSLSKDSTRDQSQVYLKKNATWTHVPGFKHSSGRWTKLFSEEDLLLATGLKYSFTENEATLVGFTADFSAAVAEGKLSTLIIPDQAYNNSISKNVPVTSINVTSDWLSSEAVTKITALIISENVKTIQGTGFNSYSALTKVKLPSGLESIAEGVFKGCTSLKELKMPCCKGILSDGTIITNCLLGLLFGTEEQEGCTATHQYYTDSNGDLQERIYYIPNSLRFIWILRSAFNQDVLLNCSKIEGVFLNDEIQEIGTAFQGLTSLKGVVLGRQTTAIENKAFMDCSNLTSIILPGSISTIGDQAFQNCSELAEITIGTNADTETTLGSIGESAFSGCVKLETIEYKESVARWNDISKGIEWNKDVPSSCVIKCSDGQA